MAKALIIFYSQAGQTEKAVRRFSAGLSRHLDVETVPIETVEPFRFPWSITRFFRVFPLCVKSVTPAILLMQIEWDRYDLIVLAYPVWFLSPALPMQAFLKSSAGRRTERPIGSGFGDLPKSLALRIRLGAAKTFFDWS